MKPLKGWVVTRVQEPEQQSAGGIILPPGTSASEEVTHRGIIVDMAAPAVTIGAKTSSSVKIGQEVLFMKVDGVDLLLGNEDFIMVKEEKIMAIITDVEEKLTDLADEEA